MKDEIKEKIKAYYVGNDIDEIIDYITNLQEEKDKYKNVIDKIKEYIITRTPSDIGICGNKPKKYYTLNEDEVDYILELLEEVE